MKIHRIKAGTTNCYLVKAGSSILIDAGMPGKFETFRRQLAKIAIDPAEIKLIILTHCHWDHVGCAGEIKIFSGAKIVVHKAEASAFENGKILVPPAVTKWGEIFGGFLKFYMKNLKLSTNKADIILQDENFSLAPFGIPATIVHTPGHSSGSVSVIFQSGEAFVGDMAMNGIPLTLKPDLPIFGEDLQLLKKSWQKLYALGVRQIFPAHGKDFPIEKIKSKFDS